MCNLLRGWGWRRALPWQRVHQEQNLSRWHCSETRLLSGAAPSFWSLFYAVIVFFIFFPFNIINSWTSFWLVSLVLNPPGHFGSLVYQQQLCPNGEHGKPPSPGRYGRFVLCPSVFPLHTAWQLCAPWDPHPAVPTSPRRALPCHCFSQCVLLCPPPGSFPGLPLPSR